MTPVLQATHIDKGFSSVQVLKQIDFDLEPGEVHALLGENGAGKSTLLKILFGDYQADAGEISINGQIVHLRTPHDAQQQGIAMIHQELSLIPELTVAQNVLLGQEGKGEILNYRQMAARARPFLEQVGLHMNPLTPVKELTIAQQQMVEIARAVALNAKILIMDEPTSSLSTQEIEALYGVVRSLTARGVGIIYVSHHFDEIEELADRISVLRDGKKVATLPQKGTSREEMVRLMVGRELESDLARDRNAAGPVVLSVQRLGQKGSFEDISFEVHAGEVVTLAGLVGAGRTEVLRSIYGADRATAGQVAFKGQDLPQRTPESLVKLGVGFISEDRRHQGIVPDAPVSLNLLLTSWAKGQASLRGPKVTALVDEYIARLKVKTAGQKQHIRRLSGGNQQKVIIARWLAVGCWLLLIDEPTRGIDVASKADIYALIDELAAQGVAVLMVSSELPEVLRLSDRVLVMREGRLVGELSREQASEESILALATGAHQAAPSVPTASRSQDYVSTH